MGSVPDRAEHGDVQWRGGLREGKDTADDARGAILQRGGCHAPGARISDNVRWRGKLREEEGGEKSA
jgi:hypothetical protein